mmetsp:Transcript_13223/g.49431  ORF Transcript_13223/g.49431 Transcript_13223/m.49431 type:complete len:217 (-) Transcript_13223:33-683(-)
METHNPPVLTGAKMRVFLMARLITRMTTRMTMMPTCLDTRTPRLLLPTGDASSERSPTSRIWTPCKARHRRRTSAWWLTFSQHRPPTPTRTWPPPPPRSRVVSLRRSTMCLCWNKGLVETRPTRTCDAQRRGTHRHASAEKNKAQITATTSPNARFAKLPRSCALRTHQPALARRRTSDGNTYYRCTCVSVVCRARMECVVPRAWRVRKRLRVRRG